MQPVAHKAEPRLTGWRYSTARQLLPKPGAAPAGVRSAEQALSQLLATRSAAWSTGRYGLFVGRALAACGLLCLAAGMAHSSVGGVASFMAGLAAGGVLAGAAAAWRQGLKRHVWRRTAAFRKAYERLHLAGKADSAIAHRFVCNKEFGRAIALQQVLGGRDTRLGWRLRANARNHTDASAGYESH